MAHVVLPRQVHHLSDGVAELDLAVDSYRSLMEALEARFPGIRAALEADQAVVIDGDIINDPLLEAIEADSEIHFLPRISGG